MCLAIPARLIEYVDDNRQVGRVDIGGVVRRVNTAMLIGEDATEPGEYVLLHVGFALSKVSEEEAARTLQYLKEMDSVFGDEMDQLQESAALLEGTTTPG